MDFSFHSTSPINNGDTSPHAPAQQPPQQAQPALTLFQQHSRLNNGIDDARKQYNQCLEEIEDVKENIENLVQVDRTRMEKQTKTAVDERESLLDELENTHVVKLVAVQEEESKAKTLRDQAQDRAQAAEDSIKTQRKAFQEACADYRHKMERLSFQGTIAFWSRSF